MGLGLVRVASGVGRPREAVAPSDMRRVRRPRAAPGVARVENALVHCASLRILRRARASRAAIRSPVVGFCAGGHTVTSRDPKSRAVSPGASDSKGRNSPAIRPRPRDGCRIRGGGEKEPGRREGAHDCCGGSSAWSPIRVRRASVGSGRRSTIAEGHGTERGEGAPFRLERASSRIDETRRTSSKTQNPAWKFR